MGKYNKGVRNSDVKKLKRRERNQQAGEPSHVENVAADNNSVAEASTVATLFARFSNPLKRLYETVDSALASLFDQELLDIFGESDSDDNVTALFPEAPADEENVPELLPETRAVASNASDEQAEKIRKMIDDAFAAYTVEMEKTFEGYVLVKKSEYEFIISQMLNQKTQTTSLPSTPPNTPTVGHLPSTGVSFDDVRLPDSGKASSTDLGVAMSDSRSPTPVDMVEESAAEKSSKAVADKLEVLNWELAGTFNPALTALSKNLGQLKGFLGYDATTASINIGMGTGVSNQNAKAEVERVLVSSRKRVEDVQNKIMSYPEHEILPSMIRLRQVFSEIEGLVKLVMDKVAADAKAIVEANEKATLEANEKADALVVLNGKLASAFNPALRALSINLGQLRSIVGYDAMTSSINIGTGVSNEMAKEQAEKVLLASRKLLESVQEKVNSYPERDILPSMINLRQVFSEIEGLANLVTDKVAADAKAAAQVKSTVTNPVTDLKTNEVPPPPVDWGVTPRTTTTYCPELRPLVQEGQTVLSTTGAPIQSIARGMEQNPPNAAAVQENGSDQDNDKQDAPPVHEKGPDETPPGRNDSEGSQDKGNEVQAAESSGIEEGINAAMEAAITAAKKSWGISWTTGSKKEEILESWCDEYNSPSEGITKDDALKEFLFKAIEARTPLSIWGKADDGYTASAKAFYQALVDDGVRAKVASVLGVETLQAPAADGSNQSEFANAVIASMNLTPLRR